MKLICNKKSLNFQIPKEDWTVLETYREYYELEVWKIYEWTVKDDFFYEIELSKDNTLCFPKSCFNIVEK